MSRGRTILRIAVGSVASLAALAVGLIVLARLSFPLPSLDGKIASTVLPPPMQNALRTAVAPVAAGHPDKTGVYPLSRGTEAFAARMLLARQAQSSIDVQYYIWHDDLTGTLLLDALRAAAARGVRVRLLLDDNGIAGLDARLAALNGLPNFEVRLFNPFVLRSPKFANYLFDFFRLNRRMHNKSFTVDNVATVIGGRNVGDEYFGTGSSSIFLDLDVLAVGQVVPDVSSDFDRYWSSAATYPIELIVDEPGDGLSMLDDALSKHVGTAQFAQYRTALEASPLVAGLLDRSLALEWTAVRLVSDDPSKALGNATRDSLMIARLMDLLQRPSRTVDLVSAYFVPGRVGTDQLIAIRKAGVRVRILTNSFNVTDVALVHAGYVKYRRELLEAGIELFELKAREDGRQGREELGAYGSSGASLHAKTFSVDGRHVFVGSFNFDPRSALLNTEMGLMIESPALAGAMSRAFDSELPQSCYRPALSAAGEIGWLESAASGEVKTLTVEPGTSFFSRALVTVVGWLPVEWML